ncbi:MAG TPA: phosphotransferase [Actinopolymorphaceae bacterium]
MPKPDLDGLDVDRLAEVLLPGSGRPYPMNEGLESRVYGIDVGTERYVLRIGSDRRSYDKDAYVASSFADAGLPVPPVVAIGEVGPHAYCLTPRLPGAPVNRVAPDALESMTAAVAAMLQIVWAQDVSQSSGFGMCDHAGNGEFTSWHDYLLDDSPVQAASERPRVPRPLLDRLYGYIGERAGRCPETRGLLHGDFGSGNVLVEGTTVTGVLD